jgi:hypothetical protein
LRILSTDGVTVSTSSRRDFTLTSKDDTES